MRRKYESRKEQNRWQQTSTTGANDPRRETDEEYNARQKQRQDEIDAILDKIRRSGYDSLTKEEKKKLFEQSRSS